MGVETGGGSIWRAGGARWSGLLGGAGESVSTTAATATAGVDPGAGWAPRAAALEMSERECVRVFWSPPTPPPGGTREVLDA